VSKVDGFNSSSRDDEAPLVELAVVLFFLVDILGLLLEPSKNGGRQLLWDSKATFSQKMKEKLKAQETKPKLRCQQEKTKSSFSIVNFSKGDPLYKYRTVSFYRGGEWTFYMLRIPSYKTDQNRMC
jgi:hypothetical protein